MQWSSQFGLRTYDTNRRTTPFGSLLVHRSIPLIPAYFAEDYLHKILLSDL